jgi:hypothetical protein
MSSTLYHKTDSLVSSSLEPNNADSRTSSSLGPSDSASQNAGSDIDKAAIEHLLKLVEAPSKRPSCLKPFVLWYHEDCQTDKTAGDIVTAANKHRPKMHLVICREDGSVISGPEFENIKHSAELLVERLIACVAKNPQRMLVSTSKVPTKSNVKKWFKAEYSQAIPELEAEQPYLHLCAAHWKADIMLGQAFMRKSDAENKRARTSEALSMPPPKQPNCAPTQIPVSDVAPINAAKRALELSPGPKSPSASHSQKRSKDETKHSGQKNKGPSASSDREYFLH